MLRSLWIAKTGLEAQQTQMDVISNNLANVNTTGFKRDRAVFQDLLYQNQRQAGALSSQQTQYPSGLQIGTGVNVQATEKLHLQGNLQQTGNRFDLAVNGNGFFQIELPDGRTAYTRDGSFQLDSQGQLVTAQGYRVSPGLTFPADTRTVTVGDDGTVTITQGDNAQPVQVGNLQLATFVNPTGLESQGQNLYIETAASGAPQQATPGINGAGSLKQGMLETSNVNIVEEMVNMITAQRAYETNSKAVKAADQMLQYVNNNL